MAQTALLVIDVQRGAFDGARCPPVDRPEALIGNACTLLSAARRSGTPVVFVQHLEDEPGSPFEAGTAHGELHEALAPRPGETVVKKRASSAFENTDLAQVLEGLGAKELVLCGLQSEHCVPNTAKAALANGYVVTVAEDGHSTWPWEGRTPQQIEAEANAALAVAGARLSSVETLAQALRTAAA